MSCTEDDGLDNGDTLVNDNTGVANDSTDVILVTQSFMTLGQDTILMGLLRDYRGRRYCYRYRSTEHPRYFSWL